MSTLTKIDCFFFYKMNNLPIEMIAEITKWLLKEDLMSARLVWHNIHNDFVSCYATYIRCLIDRNDVDNKSLMRLYKFPTVNRIYKNLKHRVYGHKIRFYNTIITFDKPVSTQCNSFSLYTQKSIDKKRHTISRIESNVECFSIYDPNSNKETKFIGIYTNYQIYGNKFNTFNLRVSHDNSAHYVRVISDKYGYGKIE